MQFYLPLKSKSSKLGDEYYRCVVENLTKKSDARAMEECLKLGREYRSALREQLKDLGRLTDTTFVERERKLIADYLALVEHDLKALRSGDVSKVLKRRPPGTEH